MKKLIDYLKKPSNLFTWLFILISFYIYLFIGPDGVTKIRFRVENGDILKFDNLKVKIPKNWFIIGKVNKKNNDRVGYGIQLYKNKKKYFIYVWEKKGITLDSRSSIKKTLTIKNKILNIYILNSNAKDYGYFLHLDDLVINSNDVDSLSLFLGDVESDRDSCSSLKICNN